MHRTDLGSDRRTNRKLKAQLKQEPKWKAEKWTICEDHEVWAVTGLDGMPVAFGSKPMMEEYAARLVACNGILYDPHDATGENTPMAGEGEEWKRRECRLEQPDKK